MASPENSAKTTAILVDLRAATTDIFIISIYSPGVSAKRAHPPLRLGRPEVSSFDVDLDF
jgi:hypothetical protein